MRNRLTELVFYRYCTHTIPALTPCRVAPQLSVSWGFFFEGALVMQRRVFFIDGFNLYHALDDEPKWHKYKWLDLRRLTECYYPKGAHRVLYFTAVHPGNASRQQRHRDFIRIQRIRGSVEVIHGKFKRRDRYCPLCKGTHTGYDEKQTDVNIATRLFELAARDEYDRAVLVTGDTDLVPAVEAVKRTFPAKEIYVIPPIGNRGRWAKELKAVCDGSMHMREQQLASSVLPDPVDLGGGVRLSCPSQWK